MDDLISRQAAIDAIKTWGLIDGLSEGQAIEILADEEKLPSVQPEHLVKESGNLVKGLVNDCISRQAAIDALHMHLMYRMGTDSNKKRLDDWINGVPSAQPEQIARDIATIIENEQDMRVILKNADRTETHSCDCEHTKMHDLVSRQSALEAMDTWDKFGCDPDGKLVRYDDDKHYVPYVHYEDMVHAVKNLPPAQPRWIPVTERLPEDGVTVWVTIKGHDVIRCEDGETLEQAIARISKIIWVTQGYWSEEEHGWNDPSFGCPLMVQPVAWMPIDTPEPWKGEQDEQVNRR